MKRRLIAKQLNTALTQTEIIEFDRIAKRLNALVARVQKRIPDAQLYLSADALNFMSGPSHDGAGTPRQDRAMARVHIRHMDGGDW